MAKLLLSCDDVIFSYNGQYYFKNKEWENFYHRYLRVFEQLRIANRCKIVDKVSQVMIPIEDERIEIIRIPEFRGPVQYLKSYCSIGAAIKKVVEGCDAAIIRLPSTIGQRVCNKVIKAGIPFAVECVYDAGDAWKGATSLRDRLLWKKIDKDMRRSCYGADGVSCVTREYLQRSYFSKKPTAFYSNYSSLALDNSFYTSERQYPDKEILTIAHVANQVSFNGRKGHNQVIEAVSALRKEGIPVKVNFVGGDYNNGISKLKELSNTLGVENLITYSGYVNRQELSSILDTSDIYVMPTQAEGLPRVIIEAMAKGLPCISTNVSGNPELLDSHFLIEFGDVKLLADRIKELIQDRGLYEKVSSENFLRSKEYGASVLQPRRDAFYSSLHELCNQKK
ncbi:MAG: glycosyltransferase family 4 protein [Bacteroidaceae bacterium]|nr:glycosyltransferase family 4 protein [Bacteroidaceae bacterium]